ncbi:hypothetical protein COO60DRAFT_245436 [Scenedesmus sp. NREL 46B-D3]|nr:hypothetical protein COO60DRAFT_245436 [Scenedesmus sp. NREL 46B-D3]
MHDALPAGLSRASALASRGKISIRSCKPHSVDEHSNKSICSHAHVQRLNTVGCQHLQTYTASAEAPHGHIAAHTVTRSHTGLLSWGHMRCAYQPPAEKHLQHRLLKDHWSGCQMHSLLSMITLPNVNCMPFAAVRCEQTKSPDVAKHYLMIIILPIQAIASAPSAPRPTGAERGGSTAPDCLHALRTSPDLTRKAAIHCDTIRHLPELPQISSDTKRNTLIDKSAMDKTL